MVKARGIKRGISLLLVILVFITSLSVSTTTVLADTDGGTATHSASSAKANAGAMMQTFANGGKDDLRLDDITPDEFRAWGVLLSNFVIPYHTIMNRIDEDSNVSLTTTDGTSEKYNVWNTFMKVWNKNGDDNSSGLLKGLLNKYKTCFNTSGMKRLYLGGFSTLDNASDVDGNKGVNTDTLKTYAKQNKAYNENEKTSQDSDDIPAILAELVLEGSLYTSCWYLYWLDDNGKRQIVFANPSGTESGYIAKAILSCMKMADVTNSALTDENLYSALYVSPFGDICSTLNTSENLNDMYCIIPACMNPFTFNNICENDDDDAQILSFDKSDTFKFYANNIFCLSNFLQLSDMRREGVSDKSANSLLTLSSDSSSEYVPTQYAINSNQNWYSFFYTASKSTLSKYVHHGGMVTYYNTAAQGYQNGFTNDNDAQGDGEVVLAGLPVSPEIDSEKILRVYKTLAVMARYAQETKSDPSGTNALRVINNIVNGQHFSKYDDDYYWTEDAKNSYKNWLKTDKIATRTEITEVLTQLNKLSYLSAIQPFWSVQLQKQLCDKADTSKILGKNSMAIIGRSKYLDVKKESNGEECNFCTINPRYLSALFLPELKNDIAEQIQPDINFKSSDNDSAQSHLFSALNTNQFIMQPLTFIDARYRLLSSNITTTGGNSPTKHNPSIESDIGNTPLFYTYLKCSNNDDLINKLNGSDDSTFDTEAETRFLSIYLGSLYADANWRDTQKKYQEHFLWWTFGETDFNYRLLDSFVHFQIPTDRVCGKLGVFNTVAGDDTNEVMGTKNFGIYTIDYIKDVDDESSTLLRISNSATKCNSDNYTMNKSTRRDAQPNDDEYIAMPESVYLLDLNIRGNTSYTLLGKDNNNNDYAAWYYSVNRNLFANIYWAYIEDIVGIKADELKTALETGKTVTVHRKKFKHLPPIPSGQMKTSLFDMGDDSTAAEEIAQQEMNDKQNDIISWVHNILSIGETIKNTAASAVQYVTGWLKSMIDSLFIGWHNHMVGIDITNGITGSVSNIGNATKSGVYSTAMGYMTTPSFSNLPITSWIMENFQFIYVVIMIFVVVILLLMVITRTRRLPQAILIFVCMAFIVVLPATTLNGAIEISNTVAEKIYSNKFQYWALMQHAEYLLNQSTANNAVHADLLDNLDRQSEGTKVGGVSLKWMAPKKWGIAEQLEAAMEGQRGLGLFLFMAGDLIDGEDYSNYTAGDTYLYRPYLAIFTEAKALHNRQQVEEHSDSGLASISQAIKDEWSQDTYKVLKGLNGSSQVGSFDAEASVDPSIATLVAPENNFFKWRSVRGDSMLRAAVGGVGMTYNNSGSFPSAYYDAYYGTAKVITDRQAKYKNNERIYDLYLDTKLINALFDFDVDQVLWETGVADPCGLWLYKNSNTRVYDGSAASGDLDENYYTIGVQTFFDYSESPYYYFYNVLSDMTIQTDNASTISGSDDFLTLLLSDETFKVTNQKSMAYGEIKDYLDMEGLFKFVIPLLDYGNQNSIQYFNKYGNTVSRTDYTDDTAYTASTQASDEATVVVADAEESTANTSTADTSAESTDAESKASVEESSASTSDDEIRTISKDPETVAEEQYNLHKQQLQAIYNMYSPWVDQFIAANNKSERVRSGYGRVEILEPCNPADYQYYGRPMAFSPAEAKIRGYEDYDLSSVEAKIQKVLKDTYYDMLELINYKDLTNLDGTNSNMGNEILVSAAAMIATFHFNQEFSDNGFMSTDITLYPQSYELKNMNFDAYLRIIMGNSMGINQISLMRSDSVSMTIYEEFIHETSIWSAIVLILEDLLAVFIIPFFKILLVTVVFVLALALAISCIINKPENMIKVFLTTFVVPLVGMIAIFIGHTLVISWFIGNGNSTNLIDTHSISVTTGDPTVTLLLMLAVDVLTSILMWKLLKFAAASTAKYIRDIASGVAALGKGTFNGLAKVITAASGVGTLALGGVTAAGRLAGGAVKGTAKVAGTGVKGVSHINERSQHKKEVKEQTKREEKAQQTREKIEQNSEKKTNTTRSQQQSQQGSSTTQTRRTGTGGMSKQDSSNIDSMAKDIKAVRGKLDGFSPNGMKIQRERDRLPAGYTTTDSGIIISKNIASTGHKKSNEQIEIAKQARQDSVAIKAKNQATLDSISGKQPAGNRAIVTNGSWADVQHELNSQKAQNKFTAAKSGAKPINLSVGTTGSTPKSIIITGKESKPGIIIH